MVDSQSHGDYGEIVSRRKFVELTGIAGAAALAGCSGGEETGNGNGNGNGSSSRDEAPDFSEARLRTANSFFDPADIQYNNHLWDGTTHINNSMFPELAKWNYVTQEWTPHAAVDWNAEPETFTVELRDDLVWSDGEPITADDLEDRLRIGEEMGEELFEFIDDYEAVDDTTLEISYPGGTNPFIVEQSLLHHHIDTPRQMWGEFVDMDDPDIGNIQSFTPMGLGGDDDVDEVIAGGTVVQDERATQNISFRVRHSDVEIDGQEIVPHPDADENINFAGYEMGFRGGNNEYHQSMMSGELDAMHSVFVPPETVDALGDDWQMIPTAMGFGPGLVFNHDDPHWGQREVRQAVAHIVDRERAVEAVGDTTQAHVETPSGISTSLVDEWIDKDPLDTYTGGEDAAESLLQDAGYERNDDGVWERDGDALEADILAPGGWTDWITAADSAIDNLNDFGIDVSMAVTPRPEITGERLPEGDFEIVIEGWIPGGMNGFWPYFSFEHVYRNTEFADEENRPWNNLPQELDGIDTHERLNDFAGTQDQEEMEEIVQELAELYNEILPAVPLTEGFEQSFLSYDGWNFSTDAEDVHNQWPLHWLPKQGQLWATE
ncbi:ABC transporter substrate-binding protein [Natrarchaeobius halalkaliphilus]|nr:ABC transporter substrate-binding protein [Natrarchaeobius halalkaliphilus]